MAENALEMMWEETGLPESTESKAEVMTVKCSAAVKDFEYINTKAEAGVANAKALRLVPRPLPHCLRPLPAPADPTSLQTSAPSTWVPTPRRRW